MDSLLVLRGARVAVGPGGTEPVDVEIDGGRILAMRRNGRPPKGARTFDLDGYLIGPGLINAHDHLEFNLYPRLGSGPYANSGCWSRDVYRPDESPLKELLAVPKRARLLWGGLKNLLSGVTTVCHHNPRNEPVFDRNFPVRVLKRFGWAHSLEFSSDVAQRFQATPAGWPFVIHLGEGVDRAARREIFHLDECGALDARTVLVHAVALDSAGLRLAKERGASIVWCPSSNLFLLGRTLGESVLSGDVPIALGSDSAITAAGDLLDEMKVARTVSGLPASAIHRMVTLDAARILRLPKGAGALAPGCYADLIVVRKAGDAPSLVLVGGKLKLAAPALARHLPSRQLRPLHVEGRGEFLVDADAQLLRRQASGALGDEIRLAGRRVLA